MLCAFFAGKLDRVNTLNIEISQLCREYVLTDIDALVAVTILLLVMKTE